VKSFLPSSLITSTAAMTKEPKLAIRFNLNIFKDVKNVCDNSSSKDFELIHTTSVRKEKSKNGAAAKNARYLTL
jgi:hypothetical protein